MQKMVRQVGEFRFTRRNEDLNQDRTAVDATLDA
jgi:hypothetical protein